MLITNDYISANITRCDEPAMHDWEARSVRVQGNDALPGYHHHTNNNNATHAAVVRRYGDPGGLCNDARGRDPRAFPFVLGLNCSAGRRGRS